MRFKKVNHEKVIFTPFFQGNLAATGSIPIRRKIDSKEFAAKVLAHTAHQSMLETSS